MPLTPGEKVGTVKNLHCLQCSVDFTLFILLEILYTKYLNSIKYVYCLYIYPLDCYDYYGANIWCESNQPASPLSWLLLQSFKIKKATNVLKD